MKYKHLFFDLDRTLWDYDKNAKIVLLEIHEKYNLLNYGIDGELFHNKFQHYNELLWHKFRNRQITKDALRKRRFYLTLNDFGIDSNDLALKMDTDYILMCPKQITLVENANQVLEYLNKHYQLHIITNGFNEVQFKKLKNSKIDFYFKKVVTSDSVGAQKPSNAIFHYALSSVNAKKSESLMIGDDLQVDVIGAAKYGIDQVYFNCNNTKHDQKPTYEITNIKELMNFL